MRIFALETNLDTLIATFASPGEKPIMTTFYHGFLFFVAIFKAIVFTAVLVGTAILAGIYLAIPALWIIGVAAFLWLIVVPLPLLRHYIDWRYDFLYLTEDKLIIVDQSFIFSQKIKQINLENIASVASETQFFNLLGFGIIRINLKEGEGNEIVLKFVPKAQAVSDTIADQTSTFEKSERSKA